MNDIQYYDHKLKELVHPWKTKISKFIKLGCMRKISDNHYQCGPIQGYNTRTYDIKREGMGQWLCNCQGFNKRGDCSHAQATMIFSFENNPNQGKLF